MRADGVPVDRAEAEKLNDAGTIGAKDERELVADVETDVRP